MGEIEIIGKMDHTMDHTFESANRVYGTEGICPTLPTQCGGGHMPKIVDIKQATKQGYIPCEVGGGMRSELPKQQNKTRKGTREWTDMPDSDNGEYP